MLHAFVYKYLHQYSLAQWLNEWMKTLLNNAPKDIKECATYNHLKKIKKTYVKTMPVWSNCWYWYHMLTRFFFTVNYFTHYSFIKVSFCLRVLINSFIHSYKLPLWIWCLYVHPVLKIQNTKTLFRLPYFSLKVQKTIWHPNGLVEELLSQSFKSFVGNPYPRVNLFKFWHKLQQIYCEWGINLSSNIKFGVIYNNICFIELTLELKFTNIY